MEQQETDWIAIRTIHCKEQLLSEYLMRCGLQCFIPMRYTNTWTTDGEEIRKLAPAVHNLVFCRKTLDENKINEIHSRSPIPFGVLREPATKQYAKIPDRQMVELRAICDPAYKGTIYTDAATAESRLGEKVEVIRGAFKGLRGKLTRYKGKRYIVISLATMGVMIHIPKWYCKLLNED